MSLRPLYLDQGPTWQVELDEGVALRVWAPGRTRAIVPLAQLARVACPATAQWETAALLATLESGVPVVFHDHRGDPVGWCFGPRRRETTLGHMPRIATAEPGWDASFDDWRRAEATRQAKRALDRVDPQRPGRPASARAVRALLCQRNLERSGLAAAPWARALRRAAAPLAARAAFDCIGDPELIGYARPGVMLAETLLALSEPHQLALLLEASPQRLRNEPALRWAASVVEARGAFLHRVFGEILGSLEHHLRNVTP